MLCSASVSKIIIDSPDVLLCCLYLLNSKEGLRREAGVLLYLFLKSCTERCMAVSASVLHFLYPSLRAVGAVFSSASPARVTRKMDTHTTHVLFCRFPKYVPTMSSHAFFCSAFSTSKILTSPKDEVKITLQTSMFCSALLQNNHIINCMFCCLQIRRKNVTCVCLPYTTYFLPSALREASRTAAIMLYHLLKIAPPCRTPHPQRVVRCCLQCQQIARMILSRSEFAASPATRNCVSGWLMFCPASSAKSRAMCVFSLHCFFCLWTAYAPKESATGVMSSSTPIFRRVLCRLLA